MQSKIDEVCQNVKRAWCALMQTRIGSDKHLLWAEEIRLHVWLFDPSFGDGNFAFTILHTDVQDNNNYCHDDIRRWKVTEQLNMHGSPDPHLATRVLDVSMGQDFIPLRHKLVGGGKATFTLVLHEDVCAGGEYDNIHGCMG